MAQITLHPLAFTFMKIVDLHFALKNGALSEEERRKLEHELATLQAQAEKN